MITRDIVKLKVGELYPYEKNMNKWTNINEVKQSLEEFGYNSLIEVDENGVILAWHSRYKAIQELGWKEVEVLQISWMSQTQKEAYRIIHNVSKKKNELDYFNLRIELREVGELEQMQELFPDLNLNAFLNVKLWTNTIVSGADMTNATEAMESKFENLVEEKKSNLKKYTCTCCGYEFESDVWSLNLSW